MSLVLKDRVLETAAAPGTGAVTLLGAVTGYQTFSAAIGNGNTCYYTIADQSGANWEVGIGSYASSGNTLARTTVLSSSNAGSTVNFASGTQNVFVTYPSEKAVYLDASGNVQPSLGTATFSSITDSGLTSGRVTYAGTGGLLQDSANFTFNGTTLTANTLNLTNALGVAYGGTGLTTLTSGYIPYGNGTSAFSSSGALQFSGSNLTVNGTYAINQSNLIEINNGQSGATKFATGLSLTSDSGGNYTSGFYIVSGSNTPYNLMTGSPTTVSWYSANSEKMRLTSTGLGIGTSSPSYALDLTSGASPNARINGTYTASSKTYSSILMGSTGSSQGAQFGYVYNSGAISNSFAHITPYGAAEGSALSVLTNGYVGIGTSSPSQILHVSATTPVIRVDATAAYNASPTGILSFVGTYNSGGGLDGFANITAAKSNATSGDGSAYLAFSTNTSTGNMQEKMRLDSSGNLGLGVTPSAWGTGFKVLESTAGNSYYATSGASALASNAYFNGGWIYKTTSTAGLYANSQGVHAWYNAPSGTAGNAITFTQAMTLDNSGNLLIGTTTSSASNANCIINLPSIGQNAILHASGVASGTVYQSFWYNATQIGSISQNGTTGVLYNITSDQRLKTNIVDAPSGNIDQIKVRSFDWKSDGSHQEYGMVAQELLEVAPYAVHQPQNPDEMMGVDYSKLVPMMIREIQDLRARLAKAGL